MGSERTVLLFWRVHVQRLPGHWAVTLFVTLFTSLTFEMAFLFCSSQFYSLSRCYLIFNMFWLIRMAQIWYHICVCVCAWGFRNWHSSPHVVILSRWLTLLSKWGAVNYLLTAALFTMQPTHQDHRTEHNTTPLVNKLDTEAKRQGDAEKAERCWGTMKNEKKGKWRDEIRELDAAS